MKWIMLAVLIGCNSKVEKETCEGDISNILTKQYEIETLRDSLWNEWYLLEKELNKIRGI